MSVSDLQKFWQRFHDYAKEKLKASPCDSSYIHSLGLENYDPDKSHWITLFDKDNGPALILGTTGQGYERHVVLRLYYPGLSHEAITSYREQIEKKAKEIKNSSPKSSSIIFDSAQLIKPLKSNGKSRSLDEYSPDNVIDWDIKNIIPSLEVNRNDKLDDIVATFNDVERKALFDHAIAFFLFLKNEVKIPFYRS